MVSWRLAVGRRRATRSRRRRRPACPSSRRRAPRPPCRPPSSRRPSCGRSPLALALLVGLAAGAGVAGGCGSGAAGAAGWGSGCAACVSAGRGLGGRRGRRLRRGRARARPASWSRAWSRARREGVRLLHRRDRLGDARGSARTLRRRPAGRSTVTVCCSPLCSVTSRTRGSAEAGRTDAPKPAESRPAVANAMTSLRLCMETSRRRPFPAGAGTLATTSGLIGGGIASFRSPVVRSAERLP